MMVFICVRCVELEFPISFGASGTRGRVIGFGTRGKASL